MATLIPNQADAFWPFSTNAAAATNTTMPDSKTPVLTAAKNLNPNPDKGLIAMQTSSDNALVAHSGLDGTIADVANSTQSDRISVYVVRPGDTLSEIATMFGVSVNTIIWANNLSSIKDVHPGDTLIILPISGVKRSIVKGDTLKSIANKYGADATEIAQFNGLDPADALVVGSIIIITGGEISAPSSPTPTKRVAPTPASYTTIAAGYYSNPLPGDIITQGLHDGKAVDIGGHGVTGTPIHAAADGMVIIARNNGGWNGGYGNYVVITHSNGTQTLYAHMKNAIVTPGQSVDNGQIIGYVGATGRVTGAHLHFEVRGTANPFASCRVNTVCSPH